MSEDERTIAQQIYDARYSFRQLVHALDRPIAELDARAAPSHGEPVRDVFGNFVFRQRLELAAYHPSIERLELGPLQERQEIRLAHEHDLQELLIICNIGQHGTL